METRELARKVQSETVARNPFSNDAAVKALEDMFLSSGRNRVASIADGEEDLVGLFATRDANTTAGPVIL